MIGGGFQPYLITASDLAMLADVSSKLQALKSEMHTQPSSTMGSTSEKTSITGYQKLLEGNRSSLTDNPTGEVTASATAMAGITPEVAKCIFQGEAGVTSADSKQYILGSYAASPCVIVSMYSEATATCTLAHIDAVTSLFDAIEMMSCQVNNGKPEPVIVEMATGMLRENRTLEDLKNIVANRTGMLLKEIHRSGSLLIDSRTGKTTVGIDPSCMERIPDYTKLLVRREIDAKNAIGKMLFLTLAFDGRTSSKKDDS